MLMSASLLVGCNSNEGKEGVNSAEILQTDWDELVEMAEGAEVGMYMWGGDQGVNQYIDDYVVPKLKENYDITLNRYPMDIQDILSKLMTEKQAGRQSGTVDIIWINGENFRNAKNNELLFGSFAQQLPNLQMYIGEELPYVHYDMGTQIEGYQAPWGNVQFVLNYNTDLVDEPPQSIAELTEWVKRNPGKFTYPNVTDFTGNAFVRHFLYNVVEESQMLESYNESWLEISGEEVWETLRSFKEFLWRNGNTYPETLAQLDQLYAKGEVAFTMGFNEHRTKSLIEDGVFPDSTKTLVLSPGSISNTHYLSIPFNSSEPAAAMVAINFMLSPEAQIKKMDSAMWGEGTVIDLSRLTDEQRDEVNKVLGPSSISNDDILAELDSRYHDWILRKWEYEVVQ
ncbi:ABC transporter substrate-binding protein [Anaerobacillus alkalilacustris]|uniref:ABC transporter substrate-binding protein n=2 Tax=Anaerobacillus alkalilacustris TaxID=393763 RepID=A0A1S2LZK9_9BACI|nr:ABC transporter substrate-binding protein [Anaerobacillus alkalilacustris]